jgi:membrane-associated phospholipid phosphatase
MKPFLQCIASLVFIFANITASLAGSDILQSYGDVMQFALPAAALGITALKDDSEGYKQWLRDMAASMTVTYAVKYAANNSTLGQRPHKNDGGYSFPSGHTAAACAGSAYLGKRYGWEYGVPAFGLAALTGYSRINAREHHWRDVIAGCALSYAMTEFFVTRQGMENIIPVIGPDFIGFRFAMTYP